MNSKNKKLKIGIIGVGYVGGALKYWLDSQGFSSFFYDKHKEIGSLQDLNKAEIIFICLPLLLMKRIKRVLMILQFGKY